MATETLEVQIKATSTGFDNVVSGASSALSGLANIGKTVLVAGLAAGTAAVGLLATGLGLALKEAMEAQEGLAQLDAVLKSTGGAAGVTRDMALELADGLSQVTRFSDDAILAGENLLLTFTNIGADVFPRATETMLDMATALGTDASGGAIQLGKALNDPIAGITALTRVGVTFTEEQKDAIAAMVEMGDIAGAQTIILDELAKEFGGSAEAAGETFAGQLDILKNSLLNVAEGVGTALLPVLQTFLNEVIIPLVPLIQAAADAFVWMFQAIMDGDPGLAFDTLREAIFGIGSQLGISEEALLNFNLKLTEVWDWITGTAIPVLQEWGKWLGENIPLAVATIQEALTTFGEWLQGDGKAAWDEFMLSIQPLVDAFVKLSSTLQEDFPLIQEKLTEFVTWAQENFGPPLQEMVDNLKESFDLLVSGTSKDLENMTGFWEEHKNEIMEIIGIVMQYVTVTISGTLLLVSGIVKTMLQLIQGDWQGALDTMQNTLNSFFNLVLSIVGTNGTEFEKVWGGIFTNIKLIFSLWVLDFLSDWQGIWDNLTLIWDTFMTNFQTKWNEGWEQVRLSIDTVIQTILGYFTELKSFINGVISGVQSLIEKINAIPGIPDVPGTSGGASGGGGAGGATTNLTAGGTPSAIQTTPGTSANDFIGMAFGDRLTNPSATQTTFGSGGRRGEETGEAPAGGNVIYQLVIHSMATTENLIDDFNLLSQMAAVG